MSIRTRLVLLCLILALLPAIPISIVVSDLVDRSFEVGLNRSVSEALEGGMAISRRHLERLRAGFEMEVRAILKRTAAGTTAEASSTSEIPEGISSKADHGFFTIEAEDRPSIQTGMPESLAPFSADGRLELIVEGRRVIERRREEEGADGEIIFYETEDRAVMLALLPTDPRTGRPGLAYRRTDPGFLADAGRLVETAQGFAGLRAVEKALRKSFILSFMIIYAAVAALTFLAAFLISERFASPLRKLAEATTEVASGNWNVRVGETAGGEIGRLADGFNDMVARLDSQRRRLTDLEKMETWREFARHLAHEIKNPLLPIRLTVQEMRDRYRGEDEAYGRLLCESGRVVDEELEHLQRLVREFSAFARMPGLSPEPGSLEALATDVAALYRQADITVEDAEAPPPFPFDADQMRRVLVNLIENSIGIQPDGVRAEIEISVRREGNSAVLTVKDNGPGIPGDDLERIFEPYFTRRRDGTGLGLAMVKSIILLHGGTIAAENRGGACFTIKLPLGGSGSYTEEG